MQSSRSKNNRDDDVIRAFGEEWTRFDQSGLSPEEHKRMFAQYFAVFPWNTLPAGAVGADIGCGSGRWAVFVAPRVGLLHLVDASAAALEVARRMLGSMANVRFHLASVDRLPFGVGTLDFAYVLGVLHHVPDTQAGLRSVAQALRPGAPLLVYLYYAFENRPIWFRVLWRVSDCMRRAISRLPPRVREVVCDALAVGIYWPLARIGRGLEQLSLLPRNWPLAYYRDKTLYAMRTDALDRFGTRLEQRFSRDQIRKMMTEAGLSDIRFSESPPYWCAVGTKR